MDKKIGSFVDVTASTDQILDDLRLDSDLIATHINLANCEATWEC